MNLTLVRRLPLDPAPELYDRWSPKPCFFDVVSIRADGQYLFVNTMTNGHWFHAADVSYRTAWTIPLALIAELQLSES
jgi:hypothetical protein